MNWERRTRNRWEAPGFEIRAVSTGGRVTYRALQMGDRRTWLGVGDSWHLTAQAARDWCEALQGVGAQDGRA